jgi:DNA-binding NarL/FixJ family response regulator
MKIAIELNFITEHQKTLLGLLEVDIPVANVLNFSRPVVLTHREREVRDQILKGLQNKEIGAELGISERAVKFHVSSIYRKYGVGARVALIHALVNTKEVA